MVVMGHCHLIDDSCLLPESLAYIYIDMYNCDGGGYQLV